VGDNIDVRTIEHGILQYHHAEPLNCHYFNQTAPRRDAASDLIPVLRRGISGKAA